MQDAIDRVMQTYGLLVTLTAEQERRVRADVSAFLATSNINDRTQLAVEGLRYLRSQRPLLKSRTRRPRKEATD
jgi:hypothetical protein